MQGSSYRQKLQADVDAAKDTNNILRTRVNQLEKQVSSLQAESIAHLNARLAEVGIAFNTMSIFIIKGFHISHLVEDLNFN